jgi:hypothetical protein
VYLLKHISSDFILHALCYLLIILLAYQDKKSYMPKDLQFA